MSLDCYEQRGRSFCQRLIWAWARINSALDPPHQKPRLPKEADANFSVPEIYDSSIFEHYIVEINTTLNAVTNLGRPHPRPGGG